MQKLLEENLNLKRESAQAHDARNNTMKPQDQLEQKNVPLQNQVKELSQEWVQIYDIMKLQDEVSWTILWHAPSHSCFFKKNQNPQSKVQSLAEVKKKFEALVLFPQF